jgi:multidrug transporter EmrE-like cation transporter
MKTLLSMLLAALLVAYSQLIVKWRMNNKGVVDIPDHDGWFGRLVIYLTDTYIISAYVVALLGSFLWLFVIARLPLAVAFPIYQGLIFVMVLVGSVSLLGEVLTPIKLLAISLILAGVVLGMQQQ